MRPTSTSSLAYMLFSFPPTSVSPIRFLFSQRSLLMDNFHFFAYALSAPPNKCKFPFSVPLPTRLASSACEKKDRCASLSPIESPFSETESVSPNKSSLGHRRPFLLGISEQEAQAGSGVPFLLSRTPTPLPHHKSEVKIRSLLRSCISHAHCCCFCGVVIISTRKNLFFAKQEALPEVCSFVSLLIL